MRKLLPIALVVMCILGCATMPLTPTGKYYDALATFNDVVESYIWHYQAVDAEKQEVLKKYVHPTIKEASAALDLWGQSKDSTTRMQAFNAVFKRLQLLLIKYGVGGEA